MQAQIKRVIEQDLPAEQFITLPLGDTNLAALIEVKEAHMAPIVEESAVLFANGQTAVAIKHLSAALAIRGRLGQSEFNAYRTLLDLYRITGEQQAFENHAIDFAVRFEKSPPSWGAVEVVSPTMISAIPTLDIGEQLDGTIIPILEQLKVLALNSTHIRLDMSNVSQINYLDGFGCELLMRVLKAFEPTDYWLEVVGVRHLFSRLKPMISARSKRVSGHVWLLYLELLRMENQPLLFDEIAFRFSMVYDLSPPQWVNPKQTGAALGNKELPKEMETNRADHIVLAGMIDGDGSSLINLLAQGFQVSNTVVCDCKKLKRLGFEAAGRLLTALSAWTSESKTVQFRNLSHPIAALFVVLGIQHMAIVERRKDD